MKLILAWLFVALPLAWGVTQSVNKSLPLFGLSPAAAPTPAPVTSSATAK